MTPSMPEHLAVFQADLYAALSDYTGLHAEFDTPDCALIGDSAADYGWITRPSDPAGPYEVVDLGDAHVGTFDGLPAALHCVLGLRAE